MKGNSSINLTDKYQDKNLYRLPKPCWELENFSYLIDHMKEFCFHAEREFLGSILRPHSPMMKFIQGREEKLEEIQKAAYESGKGIVTNRIFDSKLLEKISQPLVPIENYVRME